MALIIIFIHKIKKCIFRLKIHSSKLALLKLLNLAFLHAKSVSLTSDQAHRLIALYHWRLIDPTLTGTWTLSNPHAYTNLPVHLAAAGCFSELEDLLTDLVFLSNKCARGLVGQLLRYYYLRTQQKRKTTLALRSVSGHL